MAAGKAPGSPLGSQPTCQSPYVCLAAVRAPHARAVPVTVDQQHGPLSIWAPRPLGLEEKHHGGTGAGFPPSWAKESPTPHAGEEPDHEARRHQHRSKPPVPNASSQQGLHGLLRDFISLKRLQPRLDTAAAFLEAQPISITNLRHRSGCG